MKVVILAGGLGTRLSEETTVKPKPMVEIGGRPMLWHIMKIYSAWGFREFVVALGYKGGIIKDYFLNFYYRDNDLTVRIRSGERQVHNNGLPDWDVKLIDTGMNTQTGGRIRRLRDWIGNETFLATYGDGLSSVDVPKVVEFHKSHGKKATVTAVRPPARFGGLSFDGNKVVNFTEKPQTGEGWINGGYFVLEPEVIDYIDGDLTAMEREPMERLSAEGQLMAFKHEGFWMPMDTLREKHILDDLWTKGNPPWKVWND